MRAGLGLAAAAAVAAWAGITCKSDPFRQRLVTSELRVIACTPGCPLPPLDSIGIATAHRGDTVVVFLEVRNGLFDSVEVVLRAPCAENAALLSGTSVVRQIPSPVTCPDSTVRRYVEPVLGNTEKRFIRFVVDSGIVAAAYVLEGRIALNPRIVPQLLFTVQ